MGIRYDIVMSVASDVSDIDDLLTEPELRYLFRAKDGGENVYFSDNDIFSEPGEIESNLQGTTACVADGPANFKNRDLKKNHPGR